MHGGLPTSTGLCEFNASVVVGPGRYYIGIIDVLQRWDWWKRLDRAYKLFMQGHARTLPCRGGCCGRALRRSCLDHPGISTVTPEYYYHRFSDMVRRIIVTDQRPEAGLTQIAAFAHTPAFGMGSMGSIACIPESGTNSFVDAVGAAAAAAALAQSAQSLSGPPPVTPPPLQQSGEQCSALRQSSAAWAS